MDPAQTDSVGLPPPTYYQCGSVSVSLSNPCPRGPLTQQRGPVPLWRCLHHAMRVATPAGTSVRGRGCLHIQRTLRRLYKHGMMAGRGGQKMPYHSMTGGSNSTIIDPLGLWCPNGYNGAGTGPSPKARTENTTVNHRGMGQVAEQGFEVFHPA